MRSPLSSVRRRHGFKVLAFLAASALAAGCAAPEQEGTTSGGDGSSGSGDQSGAIKIGVNIELSGPAAVQGTAYRNAVELVAERINEEGLLDGRKIELVIRDNKSDPTESLQVSKGMVENENVAAIVGGGSSPTTLSMVDYVESAGVPIVSMGSSDAIVTPPEDRSWVFKTPAGTDLVMDVLLEEFKARGVEKVGFISVDNPYGDAGLEAFTASAPEAGIDIVGTEKFQAEDKDYTSIVTKLVAEEPEALVVWAIPPGAGIVAKNVASSGFDGDVYFDPGAGAELFIEGAGTAAEGALLVHPAVLVADQVSGAENQEQMTTFYNEYKEAYGEYSGFASYAADALGMITQAIEEAGSAERKDIRDALDTMEYKGATGVYHMSPEDHGALDPEALTLVTVENGEWQLVEDD
jgi:branched-chain amino acid transport system substrate-binding protein